MVLPRRPPGRGLQDRAPRLILLEGGRPPVRHYAGLEGVIKPAIAWPSANEGRFFVPLLLSGAEIRR
jgi:hypothetical protein